MHATLNVSLDDKVCPNATADRRYQIVRTALRIAFGAFGGVIGEMRRVRYAGPVGDVEEHCGIFRVEFDYGRPIFEDVLYGVSNSLAQDCIAVLYDSGEGVCVGPHAERWPFDPASFNLPSSHQVSAAA